MKKNKYIKRYNIVKTIILLLLFFIGEFIIAAFPAYMSITKDSPLWLLGYLIILIPMYLFGVFIGILLE